ncbi:Fur family transcriptional regulator [Pseudemcibacter aquimaris]|uniref:Fur family transcriptional regulator n=1 Tax=Pseudemcibacter aquimaris TaxID=2857064 RepID=UPI00201221C3|nr:transcriptional repressor [Pseudemcibacter aquimaris]MCC3861625.1 transcriptional repressor [Pseudemcibacter aquimaris]WDU58395.1 transcriptional repressor [Pseudemcibacter aquimaris]
MNRMATIDKSNVTILNREKAVALNPYRLTGNQKMVYDALKGLGRSAGAYELLDMLRKRGVNAAATIYRALNELTNKGLVQKIVSTRSFVAVETPSAETEESLMLICEKCGEVSSVSDEVLSRKFHEHMKTSGYKIKSYHLELMVDCSRGDDCCKKS